MALVAEATRRGLPILAICRGVQVLNVARGGTLTQDVPSEVEGGLGHEQHAVRWEDLWHGLTVVEGTRLGGIAGRTTVQVNSFHHQAAERIGEGLVVSARAPDGVIEGLEDPAHPFLVGVQWHPERRPDDPLTVGLFAAFVAAARERTASHLRS
jgi:putative glutamine amidotransferase